MAIIFVHFDPFSGENGDFLDNKCYDFIYFCKNGYTYFR
jgi:hypothetical protein